MAPMKLNSGLGGALKNDSIFKKEEGNGGKEKGLGQLKQLISIHMKSMCGCVSAMCDGFLILFMLCHERKFSLHLNGKFILRQN